MSPKAQQKLATVATIVVAALVDYGVNNFMDAALSERGPFRDVLTVVVIIGLIAAVAYVIGRIWHVGEEPERTLPVLTKPGVAPDLVRIRFAEPPSNPAEANLDWIHLLITNQSDKVIGAGITARLESGTSEVTLYWDSSGSSNIVIRPGLSEMVPFVVRARDSDVPWGNTSFEVGVAYLCTQELVVNKGRGQSLSGHLAGYNTDTLLTRVHIGVTVHYEVRGTSESGKNNRSFLVWIPDDWQRPMWVVPTD